jgi:hypothetical protein
MLTRSAPEPASIISLEHESAGQWTGSPSFPLLAIVATAFGTLAAVSFIPGDPQPPGRTWASSVLIGAHLLSNGREEALGPLRASGVVARRRTRE